MFVYCCLIFSIFSCQKQNEFFSGVKTTQVRYPGKFSSIEVYDCFDVYLKSDTLNKIEIEAGDKQIPNVQTDVADGKLTITDKNKLRALKGYDKIKLFISASNVNQITVYDASALYTVDTLKATDIAIDFVSQLGSANLNIDAKSISLQVLYGAGDYILKGKSKFTRLYASNLAFIYASEMEATSCYAANNSMGDIYSKSNASLGIEITDSGNIYYTGYPTVIDINTHTGSGKLIKN